MIKKVKYRTKGLIRNSGFSLVEASVVAALVGIVSLISLPSFYNIIQKQRLKESTLIVSDYLEKARKQALQYDYPCRVKIDNSTLVISNSNIDGTDNQDPNPNQCFNENSQTLNLNSSDKTPPDGLKLCSIDLGNDRDISQSNIVNALELTDAECKFIDPVDGAYSADPIDGSTITYTPAGLTTSSLLIKLKYKDSSITRCIAVIAPTATIRKGIDARESGCDFTNFN